MSGTGLHAAFDGGEASRSPGGGQAAATRGGRGNGEGSGAGAAADIDHVAITGRRILVDETGDQNASVEGNNLAILLATGWSGRADIILAARAALQPQLLRGRLVSQMHDDATGRNGADHVRLLALRPRRGFGARTVVGILKRRKAPAADNLVGSECRRHLGRHAGLLLRMR